MDMYDAKLKGLLFDLQQKHSGHPEKCDQGKGELTTVFLKYNNDLTPNKDLGSETRTATGKIAAGQIQVSQLETIVDHPHVLNIQLSCRKFNKLHHSIPVTQDNQVRSVLADGTGWTGIDVIIDIIVSRIKRKIDLSPFLPTYTSVLRSLSVIKQNMSGGFISLRVSQIRFTRIGSN